MDDLDRAEAVGEDHGAREHRRHERGHRLAEHVAEWKKIQETDGMEWPDVLPVPRYLLLDRQDVREDVPMSNRDAFGFGRRARREDDLGKRHRIRGARRRARGAPSI